MPCPNGVDIPYNFSRYNEGMMYEKENPQRARFWYRWMAEGFEGEWFRRGQANKCIQCRACEGKCPQGLPISDWLSVVHQVLGEGKPYPTHPQLARK
jgi:predicted aldo/keto reductase-like oxidoreductase